MCTSLAITTSIGTLIVAALVASISFFQLKVSRDKLRLDLYNRRYDIYARVLDIYRELLQWSDTPEQEALKTPFLKAVRESRFMFPKKSGVHEYLEEFSTHSFYIVNFAQTRDAFAGIPEEQVKLALIRTEHVNWILSSMAVLEDKMSSTLRFENL